MYVSHTWSEGVDASLINQSVLRDKVRHMKTSGKCNLRTHTGIRMGRSSQVNRTLDAQSV